MAGDAVLALWERTMAHMPLKVSMAEWPPS